MFSRIVLVLVVALAASGCAASGTGSSATRVVAGFYPLAYLAQQIGGAGVAVTNLTPAGAEPHDLELTAGDVREVQDARLVLYLGAGFQPALQRAVEDRSGPSLDLLVDQKLATGPDEGGHTATDPHVWLDPLRFARMATAVASALDDPGAASGLVRRLRRLDREYRRGLAECARREIVTSHAAFGYLASRYGLEQVPLTGLSPEAEPSPRDLERLVRTVEATSATTVFSERLVSPKLADTVAREAGVTTAVLDPLEGLTGDEVAGGDDYFTVMRRNLAALRQALGCR
jgi:zinc transport system substrate-binding protein